MVELAQFFLGGWLSQNISLGAIQPLPQMAWTGRDDLALIVSWTEILQAHTRKTDCMHYIIMIYYDHRWL